MYDPTVGRWLQQDPIGFEAGDVNLYRYVENNPVQSRDPSGLLKVTYLDSSPKSECGKESFVTWDFTLNEPAKIYDDLRTTWIVQKITVYYVQEECPSNSTKVRLEKKRKKVAEYWEAWYVPYGEKVVTFRWKLAFVKADYTDISSWTPGKCTAGSLLIKGEIRAFVLDKETHPEAFGTTWKKKGEVYTFSGYPNSRLVVGNIASTDKEPAWWAKGYIKKEGTKTREMSITWNCCGDDDSDYVDFDFSPKK